MKKAKLTVWLPEGAKEGVFRLAEQEDRKPSQMAALLLRFAVAEWEKRKRQETRGLIFAVREAERLTPEEWLQRIEARLQ